MKSKIKLQKDLSIKDTNILESQLIINKSQFMAKESIQNIKTIIRIRPFTNKEFGEYNIVYVDKDVISIKRRMRLR